MTTHGANTTAQMNFKQSFAYKPKGYKPNYLKDVEGETLVSQQNWNTVGHLTRLQTYNNPDTQRPYWLTNIFPVKGPMGPRNNEPLPLHPVNKPELKVSWAPRKFKEVHNSYSRPALPYVIFK